MECKVTRVVRSPGFAALTSGVTFEAMAQRARRMILNIQSACAALPDGQRIDESPPLQHHLPPGIYAREIHLAAGTLVVGKIHRHRHLNIISQGCVTVFTERGHETHTAPASFVSDAGTKRVVLTHEDAIWTTIHPNPTNEQSIPVLEATFVADDYRELGLEVANEEMPCLIS